MNSAATQTQGGAPIEPPNIICVNEVSSPYLGKALELCGGKEGGIGIVSLTYLSSVQRFDISRAQDRPCPEGKTNILFKSAIPFPAPL